MSDTTLKDAMVKLVRLTDDAAHKARNVEFLQKQRIDLQERTLEAQRKLADVQRERAAVLESIKSASGIEVANAILDGLVEIYQA